MEDLLLVSYVEPVNEPHLEADISGLIIARRTGDVTTVLRELFGEEATSTYIALTKGKSEPMFAPVHELKECPFCGGRAVISKGTTDGFYHVECTKCLVRGPKKVLSKWAIEDWNMRKTKD